MLNLHVRQVEAFRAVVTLRSMTKAAELLGISQPAVSRLMADFQETVGFRLFSKSRNSAEPTPDGQLLFEQVDKLFTGLEELRQQINAISTLQTGRLTVSATNSHASGFLPAMVAEFKRRHPGVAIAYHIQAHEQVIDWVSSGRADIGFAIQAVAKSDLTAVALASHQAHCVMPRDHRLAAKSVLELKDFHQEPFVSFPRGQALRFLIDGLFDRAKVDRNLHVEATSHHAVCALVANGMGIALVNPFAPLDDADGRLIARPVKRSVDIEVQAIYNESALSVTAQRFRDYILAEGPAILRARL
ncbi:MULTISPECIES: LysR substrate-binding domain-containing protein [Mesorhizobium]|uniref:LysR substrate-binding domain-containing protein n=1 Tax=Mesorhizobium TaxID=68287 RepID=UPI00248368BA|nr:LysR substrate-binding domain-containing protein [Mesorhizobium zhangyense]